MSHQHPSAKKAKAPAFMIPIFKLPVVLYRLGLGWLLGTRFMQLTHVGRRSGKVRQTVAGYERLLREAGFGRVASFLSVMSGGIGAWIAR